MELAAELYTSSLQLLQQFAVDRFYQIIAHLVESIDVALGLGDLLGRGQRRPRPIFLMPQSKVLPMLLDDERL